MTKDSSSDFLVSIKDTFFRPVGVFLSRTDYPTSSEQDNYFPTYVRFPNEDIVDARW